MRIVYHHRTQLGDAQGIHIRAMVRAFQELGHEVVMVSPIGSYPTDETVPRARVWRIATHRLPAAVYLVLSLAYNIYGYLRLARMIRRRGPDLIYERYAPNTFCGVLAKRRFGVPLLLELNAPWHDQLPPGEAPRFEHLGRRLERWVCSNSTRTVAVSAALKQRLVEQGVPEPQVTVMPNAIDPGVFHPGVPDKEVRGRYRLNGCIVAGFVGWLRPWHGLEELIDAVHASDLAAHGLRLLIVGAGPVFQQVQWRVRELGLQDEVILTGPVAHDQVPAHIAAIDIALQPRATAYACPMKLVEYMAMARCIVAPDQPNIRELVSDGWNARLFPPEDYRSLVNRVAELMSSPTVRASLGRNAYRTIFERNLTWRGNAARAVALHRAEQRDGVGLAPRIVGGAATTCSETSAGAGVIRQPDQLENTSTKWVSS
jgi:glycosyltransferase involved in cell wall biosynthesis